MSANAICRSFSSIVSGAANICSASTTQMMLSNRMRARLSSSMNVSAMLGRLGHPAGLEQDVLGLLGTRHHLCHRGHQIVADVATDAAVGEIDDVARVLNTDDELGVNVDRAEVIHQHGDSKAVCASENAIQQRRLASTEKAGQHGQRDGLVPGLSGTSDVNRRGPGVVAVVALGLFEGLADHVQ